MDRVRDWTNEGGDGVRTASVSLDFARPTMRDNDVGDNVASNERSGHATGVDDFGSTTLGAKQLLDEMHERSYTNIRRKPSLFSTIRRASSSSNRSATNGWLPDKDNEHKAESGHQSNSDSKQLLDEGNIGNNERLFAQSTQVRTHKQTNEWMLVHDGDLPPPPTLNFTNANTPGVTRDNHETQRSARQDSKYAVYFNNDRTSSGPSTGVYVKNPLMFRWALGALCARLQNNHKIVTFVAMLQLKAWSRHVARAGGTRTSMRRARSPTRRPSLAASQPRFSPAQTPGVVQTRAREPISQELTINPGSSADSEATIKKLKLRLNRLWGKHLRTANRFGRDKLIAVMERQLTISFRVAFLKWRLVSVSGGVSPRRHRHETALTPRSPDNRTLTRTNLGSNYGTIQRSAVLERQAHAQTHVKLGQMKLFIGLMAAFDSLKQHRLESQLRQQSVSHSAVMAELVRELHLVRRRLKRMDTVRPRETEEPVVVTDEIVTKIRELGNILKRQGN